MTQRLVPAFAALLLVAVTGLAACAEETPAGPPTAATAVICRPTFSVDGQPLEAGTAFLLSTPTGPALVTAQHLFGPAGGLDTDIAWSQMPARVSGAACRTLSGDAIWTAGKPYAIEGAAPSAPTGPVRDMAAFAIDLNGQAAPAPLTPAKGRPARGDKVWLVAQVVAGAPRTTLLHSAVVEGFEGDALVYVFDNPALELRATSGAPVVNAKGELVAINLGGGQQDGKLLGFGVGGPAVAAGLATIKPAR